MSLQDLYREVILDHYRSPRNRGRLEHATLENEGANPLCGDEVTIFATLDAEGRVTEAKFLAKGCSISQAAASMMTERIRGKTLQEAEALYEQVREMMHGEIDGDAAALGDLAALAGVRKFPVRIKCALLAWETLRDAVKQRDGAA